DAPRRLLTNYVEDCRGRSRVVGNQVRLTAGRNERLAEMGNRVGAGALVADVAARFGRRRGTGAVAGLHGLADTLQKRFPRRGQRLFVLFELLLDLRLVVLLALLVHVGDFQALL